jgi:hypothetical protein
MSLLGFIRRILMAITISTGTSISIAKTYGVAVNMTALTNAVEAVATLGAGHGVVVGDYLELTSGWDLLNSRVVRVKTVATNDVTLEAVNTVNTVKYPSGTGTGTIRRITVWTQLSQLKDLSASGGDQQFADITSLSDKTTKQVPTVRSAVTMNIGVYDDPNLAWYGDVTTASDNSTPYGLLMVFPNGSKLAANAYWSLQKVPTIGKNEALGSSISLSYAADPIRYSA